MTAGAAASAACAAAVAPRERIYFDIHTHLGQRWGQREALSVKALLGWMDENSIEQAAVLPLIAPEAWDHPLTTDYVLEQTRPHRDRLIPFCDIDPRTINLETYQAKRDLLSGYREAGAKGFGEHKVGVKIDDPRNLELFQACAEVGLPVLFHLDSHRNIDEPGLPGLERVLRQVPDVPFIGHGPGWWASIGGGLKAEELSSYPEGKTPPGGALDRLMAGYPNLYGDLSAGSGANAISRDREFGREFLIRRAERLLFGSDYLQPGQEIPQFDLFDSLDLPAEVRAKIFRENAKRLLGL